MKDIHLYKSLFHEKNIISFPFQSAFVKNVMAAYCVLVPRVSWPLIPYYGAVNIDQCRRYQINLKDKMPCE